MKPRQAIFFRDFDNAYIPNILQELYRDRVYAKFFDGKKDLTIVDIGGNIGLFTFFAYPYAKRIVIVEPSTEHVDTIKTMLEYNKMTDKVTVVQAAIDSTSGTKELIYNQNVTMHNLKGNVGGATGQKETVKCLSMDELFKSEKLDKVDFLKLDPEGSEADIIMSEGFEKVAPQIQSMVYEYHVWCSTNPDLINNCLKDYGFTSVEKIPTEALVFGATR